MPIRMYLKGKEKKEKPTAAQGQKIEQKRSQDEDEGTEEVMREDFDYRFENEDDILED